MNFPSIRIEGQIFSGELLQRLDQPDMPGQRSADFGLPSDVKVKDEIARAWADAQDYWRIFQRKLETQKLASTATTETRQQWIVPLLGLLGYQLEYQSRGAELNGKIYAISHRAVNRAQIPVHIVGYRDPAGLDRKPENATLRMSPHAMVQEYINLHDQLYGIVTNGATLRLLRDSFRLVRLNYLEFDLDRMFTDGLFADFAVLYRLLHATRLPATAEDAYACLIEKYHQDAIDQGTRIREGLSEAVEHVIVSFANGFLAHPDNAALRQQITSEKLSAAEYYQCLLRLIYRFLFLLVIEERKLVFASGVPLRRREIYERHYSLQRMRCLAENPRHVDRRQRDLWLSILATFRLFESDGPGEKIGISPLAGELFGPDAIGPLNTCSLDNVTALEGFRSLILFRHPGSRQVIRANYASLNFEEFGSVYEGLLEYAPAFATVADRVTFAFVKGDERAATGSHYTPDELVQPLIRHSLDYLIADKLKEAREIANRQVGNRDVGNRDIGNREREGGRYGDQQLQGTQDLAGGDGSLRASLPGHTALSRHGDLRTDLSASTRVGLGPGQHRGGVGAAEHRRLYPLSEDRAGQRGGIGDGTLAGAAAEAGGAYLSDTVGRAGSGGAEDAPGAHPLPANEKGGGGQCVDSGVSSPSAPDPLAEYPSWYRQLVGTAPPTCLRDYSLLASHALLSLRIADISCGSGHILLAAARRVATELAVVRTGEEQPSPTAFRAAIRDVIRECIYGVDLNPLAVELCKVALWLEAHNPGQPLNFLDHHIKCGNSIVGYVRREELDKGVPDEAFKALPGDDKDVAAQWRKRNKAERNERGQQHLDFSPAVRGQLDALLSKWQSLSAMPERSPAEIDAKRAKFAEYAVSRDAWTLKQIAAIPIAQFYIPKTIDNDNNLVSDAQFRRYWNDAETPQGKATGLAWSTAHEKRFFHWFLEFPEIIEGGGFDCILGNPPYLGGRNIALRLGYAFSSVNKVLYPSAEGNCDLVSSFFLQSADLLKTGGFVAYISTNTVCQGETRKGCLEVLLKRKYVINFAWRSIRWPGKAAVTVSLIGLHKGTFNGVCSLDGKTVSSINSFLEADTFDQDAFKLVCNSELSFKGSEPARGFMLSSDEASKLLTEDCSNRDVIWPYLNGDDFYNSPELKPSRYVINFLDWPLSRAAQYPYALRRIEEKVKPEWEKNDDKSNTSNWWWHRRRSEKLYANLTEVGFGFAVGFTSKTGKFARVTSNVVFSNQLVVVCLPDFAHYAVLDSSFHEFWAWKYGSTMGSSTLRYTPSSVFETYPFPSHSRMVELTLSHVGECYHDFRNSLMQLLWLGLTDIYNLFHSRDFSPALVAQVSKKPTDEAERGYQGLLELRRLHIELDTAVRDAYGWQDLALNHDFYEIETLPENDRVRYTISPAARKELLKRLLALNHARAAEETAVAASTPVVKSNRGRKAKAVDAQGDLFG